MNQKNSYKLVVIIGAIFGMALITFMYIMYSSLITSSIVQTDGMLTLTIIILIRIIALTSVAYYMFHKWFKQEKQYFSDIPFLFGLFFLILTFGKAMDLIWDLIFFSIDDDTILLLLKIRFFIIIFTTAPMVFLSISMILYYFSLKEKYKNLKEEKMRNKLSQNILAGTIIIEGIAIIIAPDRNSIAIMLPLIVLPSISVIVWLFYFSYKNKALSQVNSKILTIGFGGLLVSQTLRPIIQYIFGETTTYIIICEIIDFFVFFVIILGFFVKAKYAET
ncbi:MAG: hypothetical protein ACFFHV_23860 [Promethearchaeota archaeon]